MSGRSTSSIVPVAEVEVAEVSVLEDCVIEGLVQNLYQGAHVGKVLIHLGALGKIARVERK